MRRIAVGLALAALLPGCGDDDATPAPAGGGQRAEVEAVFRSFLESLRNRDGDGACAAMTPGLKKEMLAAMRAAGAGELVKGRSCGEVLDLIAEQNRDYQEATRHLRGAQLGNVRIDGDRATYDWKIVVLGQSIRNEGAAARVDGRWLVSCCVPGR